MQGKLRTRRRRENFSVARFFLKLVAKEKWGRRKRIRTLEWLSELRKEINESAAEQPCMDNISTGLNESNDSSISDSSESLSTPMLLL